MTSHNSRSRIVGVGTVASVAAALVLALAVTAQGAPQKLIGTVGPGYKISLKTASGKKVTALTRGSYAITVRDRSDEHNFFLRGPGLTKALSGIDFVGTKAVTVTLRSGKYAFVCTPHAAEMHGSFSVR